MDDFVNMLIAKHESSYKTSAFYQYNAPANESIQNPLCFQINKTTQKGVISRQMLFFRTCLL